MNGKQPEAHIEGEKLLFVAEGLARPMRSSSGTVGMNDFDVPEFKHPMINGFSSQLCTYLGGNVMDASLEDILHWARQGYELDLNKSVEIKRRGKIFVVSLKDLSEKERTLKKR